jgi:hypothetical protein
VDIRVTRTPIYRTIRQESVNGRERTASRWSQPRFRFSVTFNVLRTLSPLGVNEVWSLLDLWHKMLGPGDDFWFPDKFDGSERKVRFDSDELEMERFLSGRWKSARIDLITTGEVRGGGATGLGDLLGDAPGA